jgi:magnesium transporter
MTVTTSSPPSEGNAARSDAASSSFLFLSDILYRPVEDSLGDPIGRLDDLSIDVTEPFPRVRECVIRQPWPNELRLSCRWNDVGDFHREKIHLTVSPDQLVPASPEGINEVRLRRDVLDKQVVDVSGLKIVRVNDIHLLVTHFELRVMHVDVGFRGLVRRLGLESFIDGALTRLLPQAFYLRSDNLISWQLIETLSPSASHHHLQLSLSRAQLHQAHPADIADLIAELDPPRRLRLFRALDPDTRAKALAKLPVEVQARLLEMMSPHEAATVMGTMPPDEAADLLAGLPNVAREELLAHMSHEEASDVQGLLAYPPGTAGALMNTEFIVLSHHLTVGEALEELRASAPSAETIYYLYVVNEARTLVGVLSLRSLITESPATPIAQVMLKRPVSVQADDTLAECASLVAKYKLLALPVVRPDHTMLGVITVEDVLGEVVSQAWTRKFARR